MRPPAAPMPLLLPISTAALVLLAASSACTSFGATLPPGAAGGSFLDEPLGMTPFSPSTAPQKSALDAAARVHVDANIDVLIALADASRAMREDLALTEQELVAQADKTGSVDAVGLGRIRDLARRYLELDALLYALWTTYREHLPYRSEPDPYAPMRASTMLSASTREAGGLLALTAEIVRLENAAAVVGTLEEHHAITRFLNRGDEVLELPAEGFDRCIGALYDPDHRSLLERQLQAVLEERERLTATANGDVRVGFLVTTLQSSKLAQQIIDEDDGARRALFLWKVIERSTLHAVGPLLDAYIESGYVEPASEAADD